MSYARSLYRPQVESLEERTLMSGGPPPTSFLFNPVTGSAPLAMHIHPHLTILLDGQNVVIPAGVGLGAIGDLPMHTHDATGKLHIESPVVYDFQLQDWFTIWGTTPTGHATIAALESARYLAVTENGVPQSFLLSLPLHDLDQIVITALSPNPDPATKGNEAFVAQAFHDLLHRDIDPLGMVTFATALDQGLSRVQVVQIIESSGEFQTQEVRQLYQIYLHRDADAGGLAAFTSLLASGGTVTQVASAILGSGEYLKQAGGTNSVFLTALYADVLHRSVDEAGKGAWSAALASGMSRGLVANQVLHSSEAERLVVDQLYLRELHRHADAAGLTAFVAAAQQGLSEEMILASIVASGEYAASLHGS